jgi:hypothetical protein
LMSRRTRLSERGVAMVRGGAGAMRVRDRVVTRAQMLSMRYKTRETSLMARDRISNLASAQ